MSEPTAATTTPPADQPPRWRITRRGFLIGAGATGALVGAGLLFGVPFARLKIADVLDQSGAPFGVDAPPFVWFELTADNHVVLHAPKVEMGQGIHTALGQIAAEELGIEWEQLRVVQANTTRGPNDSGGTGGSSSVPALFTPLREAAATLRETLRLRAAGLWGVPAADLTIAAGIISAADGRNVTYGELVAANAGGDWPEPDSPPALKLRSAWRYIGKSQPRVDFAAKLTGQARYGYDMRLPNMLYGAVARPATIEGKLRSAAAGAAASMPGVVRVVIEDDLAAVVAETRIQADLARNRLETTWDDGRLWQQDEIDALCSVGSGRATVIQRIGNAQAALRDGTRSVLAEYRTPLAAHAHLEPQAALVDVQADRVTAYVSTQFPETVRGSLAQALGVDEALVEVQATYLGGGFGRKLNTEVAIEAARLSRAVGRPVHVGYNRREEFRNGYLRPPTHSLLKAMLDADGRMTAIEHQQASGDVAFPFFPAIAASVLGADFGAWRGARIAYDVPNIRTVAWRTPLPVATGWWRGLGLLANTFAVESFIDEVAHAAGADPLAFRLAHLGNGEHATGLRGVLEAAAAAAGWGTSLPAGRARGIACSIDVGTPVAQVVELSLDAGRPRVHKVTCAIDPGIAINPDGVVAQSEGSIIMGLSSTFLERITIRDGAIASTNFDSYPLLTMKDAPEIEVIVRQTGDAPRGVGEPPIGPIAAAVANALFALTGQRLRELPLTLA